MSQSSTKSVVSKVSVESQTVLPREVRERLGIGPGDRLRYVFDADGIRIEKETQRRRGRPLLAFTEGREADDEAYGDL